MRLALSILLATCAAVHATTADLGSFADSWRIVPVDAANAVIERVVGAALWTPSNTTTAVWLDASTISGTNGQRIDAWSDLSGNGRSTSQTNASLRPSLATNAQNGRSVLRFAGTEYMTFSASNSTLRNIGHAMIFAACKASGSGIRNVVWISTATTTIRGGLGRGLSEGRYDASGRRIDTDSFRSVSASIVDTGACVVACGELSYSNATARIWVNGVAVGTNTTFHDAGLSADVDAAHSAVGANSSNGTGVWIGDIAEVVIITGGTSADTRQRVEGYLAHKWGAASDLPEGHPYKSSWPTQ